MKSVRVVLLLVLFAGILSAQSSITFNVQNVEAAPGGPWMLTYDSNPAHCGVWAPWCNSYGNYAYQLMRWNTLGTGVNMSPSVNCCATATGSGIATTALCSDEQTTILAGIANTEIVFDQFSLSGFQHIVVGGSMGDRRIYAGASGAIRVNGVDKLKMKDARETFVVPYPAPCGPGGAITGYGWATIDTAASDPAWLAEFDPYGTHQVEFEITSFSQVLQQCYGTYSCTMKIKPSTRSEYVAVGFVRTPRRTMDTTISLAAANVSVRFLAASYGIDYRGTVNTSLNSVTATQLLRPPGGAAPASIKRVAPVFWRMSSTLDSTTASVTFDCSRITGFGSSSTYQLLGRQDSNFTWTILTSTLVDNSHLRVDNVQQFGEVAVGSTTTTDVQQIDGTSPLAPSQYALAQNYPNPFNPTTMIRFAVERSQHVSLKVYTIDGREVAELFAGSAEAHLLYHFPFDGTALVSGTYLCRLVTEDRNETIKLSLVK